LGGACVLQFYCSGGAILLQDDRRFSADNRWLICVCLPKDHRFSVFMLG